MKRELGPEEFKLAMFIAKTAREQMLQHGWEDVGGVLRRVGT
jgi:hypothetical protein